MYSKAMAKKKPTLYTITEAAKRLGCSRAAVHLAIQSKRLKAKRGTFQVERVITRTIKGWCIAADDLKTFVIDATAQEAGKKKVT